MGRQFPKLGALAFVAASIAVAGCAGGSSSSSSVPSGTQSLTQSVTGRQAGPLVSPTLTPPPFSGSALSTKYGYYDKNHVWHNPVINGKDMVFTPPVADGPNGGHGPVNTTLDGVTCAKTMSSNYHIHVFVGLYVNGAEYAIARGVGVVEPLNPNAMDILYATQCFYYTHTHDSTGIFHIEDYNNGVVEKPATTSKYNTGQLFAIWGITVNQNQFGQFAGPLRVFTSGQVYRYIDPQNGGTIPESRLTQWTGDPAAIPLYDHEVIWYMVGPNYPAALPSINYAGGY